MPSKWDRSETESPPKKKAKEKASGRAVCVSCDKIASKGSVECECCFNWIHHECASLSVDEFQVISNSSPNIMFFCYLYWPKATITSKFFNEIEDKQKSLEVKLLQLENDLKLLQIQD